MFKSKFIFLVVMAGLFFYAQFAPAEEIKPLYPYPAGDVNDLRYMRGDYGLAEDIGKVGSINPDNVVWRSLLDIAVRQPDGSIEIVNVNKSSEKLFMRLAMITLPVWGPLALLGVFDNPEQNQNSPMSAVASDI